MDLIDEEEDIAILLDLIHHRFDPLFKLTAVFRSGDHEGQVERDQFLFSEVVGDFAFDNGMGKTFNDRCFTDTRFTDEDRVVFAAAAEDQDEAFDFFFSADDRIEFPFAA